MKLYYSPGACSLAAHIVAREVGIDVELIKTDIATKKTAAGDDYLKINPKGYVPALQLDSGEVLTEVTTILQYLADQRSEMGLIASTGSMERYRVLEWLNFIATEVHKTLGALFHPRATPEMRDHQIFMFGKRTNFYTRQLMATPYLMGDNYTVADAYLFTILNWTDLLKIDTSKWPVLKEYRARIAVRPAVRAALSAEGLLQ